MTSTDRIAPTASGSGDLSGKRCLVTGGSGGIGEALAAILLERGAAEVILVARASERLEAARSRLAAAHPGATVRAEGCELSRLADVRALAQRLVEADQAIDVLVSNAAIIPGERRVTAEGLEETLATNHLAPYLLARLLLPRMRAGGRVVVVGADPKILAREPVALDDLAFERDFAPVRAYMRSKNMNAMFAYALARRASAHGVTVNAAHPGVIGTSLGRNTKGLFKLLLAAALPFLPNARRGADTPAWLAFAPELEGVTGRFYVKRRPQPTAPHTLDEARQEELWARSAQMVGLPP